MRPAEARAGCPRYAGQLDARELHLVERDDLGAIAGGTSLGVRELRWSFVPLEPWRLAPHALSIATTIEDLAGNNIGKPFDVDLAAGVQRRVATETVSLPFTPK